MLILFIFHKLQFIEIFKMQKYVIQRIKLNLLKLNISILLKKNIDKYITLFLIIPKL
jgi:hypothetical protein